MSRLAVSIVFASFFFAEPITIAADQPAGETTVWVTPIECRTLVAHRADPSVEYRPGVDAGGRPVTPADLPGDQPLELGADEVQIELRIPLSEFYDAPASLQPLIGNAEIDPGRVTVRDGIAYLGEHRLAGQDQNAIAKACAERL